MLIKNEILNLPNITTVALWVRAEELQWKLKMQYNKEGSQK
jgi:hypothetical protein